MLEHTGQEVPAWCLGHTPGMQRGHGLFLTLLPLSVIPTDIIPTDTAAAALFTHAIRNTGRAGPYPEKEEPARSGAARTTCLCNEVCVM